MTNHAYSLSSDLMSKDIPLDKLFLDPNNPRFVDRNWQDIPDEKTVHRSIQEETERRLGEKFDTEKLRANMELNGYLPIDRIVVRKLSDDNYLVLEGNRRVCAAKALAKLAAVDSTIPEDVKMSVNIIPSLVYTGEDSSAAWIFQGLRHIIGIVDWPAFNKAKLLVTQMEEEGLSLTEVGQRFGTTSYGAGQWVRGYKAYVQAIDETDYGQEIDEKSYPYFQELFGRSSIPMREWIGWDDANFRFSNNLKLNEFVGWLYPKPEDPEVDGNLGIWENRRLSVRDDLRKLAYMIRNDKNEFEVFRRGDITVDEIYARLISKQYEQSADRKKEVFESISNCISSLENLPFKMLIEPETKSELSSALEKLRESIKAIEDAMK